MKIKAPAKLNLRLKFQGRRIDGFHLLSMLNCSLALSDEIEILINNSRSLSLTVDGADLGNPDENLIIKAAKKFLEVFNLSNVGLDIKLKKNIPVGAGLGGGSSDAAAVISALGSHFKQQDLLPIAKNIGSDVPYSLNQGFAWVRGVGDEITKISAPDAIGRKVSLIIPDCNVSTPYAYQLVREKFPVLDFIEEREFSNNLTWAQILDLVSNDFQPIVSEKFPRIAAALLILKQEKDLIFALSGSGSSIFAIRKDRNEEILSQETITLLRKENARILDTQIIE